jgi:hypothetical protein
LIKVDDEAAAEAARKAIEEAARRAREAAERAAAELARKMAEVRAAAGQNNTAKLGITAKKVDELSTGQGSALRQQSLAATGANNQPAQLTSDAPRFNVAQLQAMQKAPIAAPAPGIQPEVKATVDSVISPQASDADKQKAYAAVQQYVTRVGGVGDAGITQDALYGRAQSLLEQAKVPTAASDPVRAQVDVALSDKATPAQRQALYAKTQAYVDSVGGLGDAGIVAEAVPQKAAQLAKDSGVPAVDPDVAHAVDLQLSPNATTDQRQTAYAKVQQYVDQVGGVGDAGITADALPAQVNTLLANTGVPTVAGDAVQKVQQAAQNGSPTDIAKALDDATQNLPPEQVDAALKQLAPTLDAAGARLNKGANFTLPIRGGPPPKGDRYDADTVKSFYTSLNSVASRGTDAGAQVLAHAATQNFGGRAVGTAQDVLSSAVQNGDTRFTTAFTSQLQQAKNTDGANAISKSLADGVQKAKSDYQKAADEFDATTARLQQEVAALGPALSPQQRQDYETQFWADPKNKAVKDAEQQKGDAFSKVMGQSHDALVQAAASGNKDAAHALLDGYEQLARSPGHAAEAITFAGEVNQAAPALTDTLKSVAPDKDLQKFFSDNVLAVAIPNEQANLLAKGLDPKAVDEQQKKLFEALTRDGALGDVPKNVKKFLEEVQDIRAGHYDPIERALDSWDKAGKLGKVLSVATVVGGLYGAAGDFKDGNIPDGLKKLLTTAPGGLELASGVLGTLAKSGKIAGESAEGFAKVAGKFAPGIGLAIDLISLHDNIDALKDGASPGDIVSLVGNGISIVGDIAGFIPVLGTAVDAALGVIGGGLQIIGGILNAGESPGQIQQDEQTKLLQQLGYSKDDATQLSMAGSQGVIEDLAPFGMSDGQVREAVKVGTFVDHGALGGSLTDMSWVEAIGGAFGVKGGDFLQLLKNADMRSQDYFSLFGATNQDNVDKLRKGDVQGYRKAILDQARAGHAPQAFIDQLQQAYDQNLPPVTDIAKAL